MWDSLENEVGQVQRNQLKIFSVSVSLDIKLIHITMVCKWDLILLYSVHYTSTSVFLLVQLNFMSTVVSLLLSGEKNEYCNARQKVCLFSSTFQCSTIFQNKTFVLLNMYFLFPLQLRLPLTKCPRLTLPNLWSL